MPEMSRLAEVYLKENQHSLRKCSFQGHHQPRLNLNAQFSTKQTPAADDQWETSWEGRKGAMTRPTPAARELEEKRKKNRLAKCLQPREPRSTPLLLDLPREQPRSCLDWSECLVEHFHCTAVGRWLVKTWDACVIYNPLGDRDQLGWGGILGTPDKGCLLCKTYDTCRKAE